MGTLIQFVVLPYSHINGSNEITSRTVYILRKIINSNQWHNPDELIELVRKYGKLLTSAKPLGKFFFSIFKY